MIQWGHAEPACRWKSVWFFCPHKAGWTSWGHVQQHFLGKTYVRYMYAEPVLAYGANPTNIILLSSCLLGGSGYSPLTQPTLISQVEPAG